MRVTRGVADVPSYFRVACSLLPLGIDGSFFFVATDSYMFDEAFELEHNRPHDSIRSQWREARLTSVSAANWVSCKSERIFCAALTVSLSNPASMVDGCGSRKVGLEFSGNVVDGGLEEKRRGDTVRACEQRAR